MKKVLFVVPQNLLQSPTGTNVRILQIIDIIKEMGYEVDQFGYDNFHDNVSFADFEEKNKERQAISRLHLYDFKNDIFFNNKLLKQLLHWARMLRGMYIPSWVTPAARKKFHQVIDSEDYEAIVVLYSYLVPLLQKKDIKARKIYFMEDSIFFQQSYVERRSRFSLTTAGKLLDSDLELMKLFDVTVCISKDEQLFYQRMLGDSVKFIPHLMQKQPEKIQKPVPKRKWDAFFIGFANSYNEEGIQWFLEKVYPHLDKNLKILLGGSATKCIESHYDNVETISFIEDLDAAYEDVKVVLCPMLRGTGMKIKVVEALARGLPVVCTDRGVDGLPDKTLGGCLATQDPVEFAGYINRLCADPEFYNTMSDRAWQYYTETFDKDRYVQVLKKALQSDIRGD